jgi:hypothetical protein
MIFRGGEYVRHRGRPDRGIGRVLSIGGNGKITVFFLRGGKRILHGNTPQLEPTENPHHHILELAGAANWSRADRHLSVVELRPELFERERTFFEANLHWLSGKLCLYAVGWPCRRAMSPLSGSSRML